MKSGGGSSPRQWICPECGFDVDGREACRVCGYDPRRDLCTPAAGAEGNRFSFVYIFCLVAVFSVLFIVTDLSVKHRPPAASLASAAAQKTVDPPAPTPQAPAPQPAAPAPQPGTPKPQPEAGPQPPAALQPSAPAPPENRPKPAKPAAPRRAAAVVDVGKRITHPPLSDRESYVSWMLEHTSQKERFLRGRWDRAQAILSFDGINNQRVLEAFLLTPREYFCRDIRRAYESAALPIGYGQTISGPHMVARMTDYLNPLPGQKVLEIGTGSGYQSGVLSELSNHVYTIEIVAALAEETDQIYTRLEKSFPEYGNIRRKVDDGYYGWREYAPFDRIIVTCGIDHVPPELLKQLAPNGIMVIPVGPPSGQTIMRIVKRVASDGTVSLDREDIYHGKRKEIFVPFTAREGGVHSGGSGADEEKATQ